jgi:putative ABC transport system permease protein
MWRHSLRGLAKNPGLVVVVVVTLALGIGGTTAIFSVVDAVVVRPLPFPNSDRLVVLDDTRIPGRQSAFSFPNLLDLQMQTRALSRAVGYTVGNLTLTGRGEARRAVATVASPGLFEMLGVNPARGRTIALGEEDPGAARVVVVSHAFWQTQLGGAPDVIGTTVTLDGTPHTVVGVAPEGFQFPLQGAAPDLYMTFTPGDAQMRKNRGAHFLSAIGRLAPGQSVPQAAAELATIHARLEAVYGDAVKGRYFTVAPLHDSLIKDVRVALLVILGAVGFVLLIACSNVANLLLTRASGRRRELAIRAALGASRRRLIGELLAESTLLSLVGGAAGALLALWGVDWLRATIPPEIGGIRPIEVDLRVLGFTVGVALGTGLIFGLIPAWNASRARASEALQIATGRGGVSHAGTRNALVIAEVALAMLLLIGAGLMLKSFQRLQQVSPGFDPSGVTVAEISLPDLGYPQREEQAAYYRRLLDRLAALPGAESTAIAAPVPFTAYALSFTMRVIGRPAEPPGKQPAVGFSAVSPEYHRAMRIPLLRGRLLEASDDAPGAAPAVLISEALARRHFPDEDPLGKKLSLGYRKQVEWTIVGVVGSVKFASLDADGEEHAYVPFSQAPLSFMFSVAGSAGPELAASLRAAVAAIDAGVPAQVSKMDDLMRETLSRRRLSTTLLTIFAGVALLLALIGIYGVVSYGVAQRRHEMSLRLALGARPAQVVRLIVGEGVRLALVGVGLGIATALVGARILAGLLYHVDPIDAPTFAVTAVLLAAVAGAASYLPARRAGRLDPMRALRDE